MARNEFTGPWEICGTCDGDGKHSQRLGVINVEEWEPEDLEAYMGGRYDAQCSECDGEGKVRTPGNEEEREQAKAAAQCDRESYYERRAEAWACGERD